jgi:hypothetical protein
MTTFEDVIKTAQAIQKKIDGALGPPDDGRESKRQEIVYKSLVKGTRGYIEKIANQANGAYEQGWYDATAVMIRRLLETLIIECFEKHKLDSKIKNSQGDFFFLRDLVVACLSESTWNLGRNTKLALPKLKDVGDKSAHSRRFIAQKKRY